METGACLIKSHAFQYFLAVFEIMIFPVLDDNYLAGFPGRSAPFIGICSQGTAFTALSDA